MQVRYAVPRAGMAGCLLAALLLSACGGSDNKTAAASGPQRLDVSARDYALKINGSTAFRPGPVTITARNFGRQAHGMVLVKLNDGVDTPMLISALNSRPDRIPNLMTYVGGTTALPSGAPWRATTSFDAGNYAMLDVGTSRAGRYNFTRRGEVQGFTVSGKPVTAHSARPSASISLYDYGINVPKVIPRSGTIRVENTGNDDHQLAFLRVANAAEAKRLVKAFQGGKPVRPTYRPIEVLAPTSAATSSSVRYALPQGAYIAYCSYRTSRSGSRPHASLGMVAAFAVAGK